MPASPIDIIMSGWVNTIIAVKNPETNGDINSSSNTRLIFFSCEGVMTSTLCSNIAGALYHFQIRRRYEYKAPFLLFVPYAPKVPATF